MKSNGFTLVEVLVVIAILGILFGLSVGGVQRYIAKSQQQAYDTLASSSVEATKEYVMNHPGKMVITLIISKILKINPKIVLERLK